MTAPTTPTDVVRRLLDSMQARDWRSANDCVSPSAMIVWPASGEAFTGPAFVAVNEAYPEGWKITIVDVLEQDDRVAARFRVDHDDNVFWCAGFYTVDGGRIIEGVEHWLTENSEAPPAWRAGFNAAGQ